MKQQSDKTVATLRVYALVAAMGFLGAALRYTLGILFPDTLFPFSTLLINTFGCFTLEILHHLLTVHLAVPQYWIRATGLGFLGAFSTLSAFSNQSICLLQSNHLDIACAYISATLVICFVSALAGSAVTRRIIARHDGLKLGER